jgi:hypothetical protein
MTCLPEALRPFEAISDGLDIALPATSFDGSPRLRDAAVGGRPSSSKIKQIKSLLNVRGAFRG